MTICGFVSNYTTDNCNWSGMSCSENCTHVADPAYLSFRDQSRFWFQRVLVPIITVIGVVGNSITIYIMSRRRMRSSTNSYLAALAMVDMLYLVFSFVLSLSHYPNIHNSEYYSYWRFRPFAIMLTDTFSNTSVWLTVTFTVERYIAVCHPMKGKIFCTESRARKAIFAVFLICLTLTLPTPFEHQVEERMNDATEEVYVYLGQSDLGKNPIYQSVFYWLITVLFIFLPLVLLAVFNSFLIHSLHTSGARRKVMAVHKDTRDASRQERRITVMLVSVVILFFVCQLPTAMVLIYYAVHDIDPEPNEKALLDGLGNFFNFLMAINAAGNFVLYCLFSQKYRLTFLQAFCPCLKGRIYHLHSTSHNTVFTSTFRDSPRISHKAHEKVSAGGENGRLDAKKEKRKACSENMRDMSYTWRVRNRHQTSFATSERRDSAL